MLRLALSLLCLVCGLAAIAASGSASTALGAIAVGCGAASLALGLRRDGHDAGELADADCAWCGDPFDPAGSDDPDHCSAYCREHGDGGDR